MKRPVVRDTDKGFREIMTALRGLEGGRNVVVGIRQEKGSVRSRVQRTKAGTRVVEKHRVGKQRWVTNQWGEKELELTAGSSSVRFVKVKASNKHINDGNALSLAQIATVNEFGGGNVPERSFMRSTFDENRSKYQKRLERFLVQVIDGKIDLDRALGLMGTIVVRDVKVKIRDLRDPPNAPLTIKLKGSSNPLIDTGRMRQSIDFEVRGGRS